jgi:outer membrane protein assembly factor BamB
MKQLKALFLPVVVLLSLVLVSCSGGGQPMGGWSGPTVQDGIIYVGSRDGRVVAMNSSSQGVLWSYALTTTTSGGMSCGETSVPILIYTTPIVDGDLTYIGTYGGQVLALNSLARSQELTFPQQRYGEWRWNCPIGNAKSNAIVAGLVLSGNALYVASSNGRVYSLDKGSGDENWNREDIPVIAEKLWTPPVIRGDTLYISTFDGHIYALSAQTGKLLDWSFEAEAGFASPPASYEDALFVGSFDRYLYAVEIGSEEPMWTFPRDGPAGNWFWASPITSGGIVYAGCLDGKVYAIGAETGEGVWEFDTGSPVVCSPILIENILVVANEAGDVYIVDPGTGENERIENRENGDKPTINARVRAPICAYAGLVYIRGEDNAIHIVDIGGREVRQSIPLTGE